MNHASLIPVMGLVKEADFLGTHSSSSTAAAIAARVSVATTTSNGVDSSGVRSGGGDLPVFSETQLGLVADRIPKHDWPVVANCLRVPSNMLGDVGIVTILR